MPFKKSTISAIIILVSLMTVIGLSGLGSFFGNKQNDSSQSSDNNGPASGPPRPLSMEKVSLTTKDGVKIVGNLYEVENPLGWLILVHAMPETKESYQELAQRFQNVGYESIAIDLRGHGESNSGPSGYLDFSNAEHQKSILDLDAAVSGLIQNRNAVPGKIYFIGASIGANLVLQFISEHSEFSAEGGSASGGKKAVLLSAGLNYRGIKTEPMVKNLKAGQKVLFVSSKDDTNNEEVAQENQKLYNLLPDTIKKESEIKIYPSGGHGTDILKNQPELISLILEFLK